MPVNSLIAALDAFPAISLAGMDEARLMDRIDRKYCFHEQLLPSVLSQVVMDYRILEISGKRMMGYYSVYFDTGELNLYQEHHNGCLNRYKVRFRKYESTGQVFFEVKFRNNKGRTVKRRLSQTELPENIPDEAARFLEERTPLLAGDLTPSLRIHFDRITLVSNSLDERVTIDTHLGFSCGDGEALFPGLTVIEIKQQRSNQSRIGQHLKQIHIRRGSLSKYCLGISSLKKGIKINRFKTRIRKINHITHATPTAT